MFGRKKKYKWPQMRAGERYLVQMYPTGDIRAHRVQEISPNGMFLLTDDYCWRNPADCTYIEHLPETKKPAG